MDMVGERNRRREEGRSRSAVEIAIIISSYSESFLKPATNRLLSENRQSARWVKTGVGQLKLNSDGAFDPNKKDGG